MGAGWVWLFLGLEPEKRSRNWQVPPPRWLACSEPRLVLDTSRGNSDPVGGSQLPRPKHCSRKYVCRWKRYEIPPFLWAYLICLCIIFLFGTPFEWTNGFAHQMLSHRAVLHAKPSVVGAESLCTGSLLHHMCVLNHCGEVVTISEFYWI